MEVNTVSKVTVSVEKEIFSDWFSLKYVGFFHEAKPISVNNIIIPMYLRIVS